MKEILQNHDLALYDDKSAQMVPLPPAEPPAINVYTTVPTLAL